jgi:hypothetical protein
MTDEETAMPKTTQATPNRLDSRFAPTERMGPVGRAVRLLLAVGFPYGFATLIDQGGPASVRDPDTLTTDAPFVVVTIAMVAVYAIPGVTNVGALRRW